MGEADRIRKVLKEYWDSPKWASAVDKASDSQVAAIYMRLKLEGKLKKEKK